MSQQVQIHRQFEGTKQVVQDSFSTIIIMVKQADKLLEVAKTLKNPEKKKVENTARGILNSAQTLADQNEEIFNNYADLADTALRNR